MARGYRIGDRTALGGDAPGWYATVVPVGRGPLPGPFVVGPLDLDGDSRAWLDLPDAFLAWWDPSFLGFRVGLRVDMVDGIPDGMRIVDPADPERWVRCDGSGTLYHPHDAPDLVALHARAHRAEHRGRRVGSGLTPEAIAAAAQAFRDDPKHGRDPVAKELKPILGYSTRWIEEVAQRSEAGSYAVLIRPPDRTGRNGTD